jgi:hypothetical protein
MNRMKRQSTEWEEIFVSHTSDIESKYRRNSSNPIASKHITLLKINKGSE